MTDTFPDVLRHSDEAYESIRAINHLGPGVLPAPIASDVIGKLRAMSDVLPGALGNIGVGLSRSLSEFMMIENDGGDPLERAAAAEEHLKRAAELADELGEALKAAQSAISRQGYRQSNV